MPQGVGGIVYLSDEDENIGRVSTAGRAFFSESYTRVKNHSPINVTAGSGGTGFESISVGRVVLRSESGNGVMWWGGTSDDAPFSGKGMPLWGGQKTPYLPVTNFNSLRIVASVSGQIVYAIGFLNGPDITLINETVVPPEPPIERIPPIVVSHSPVSGFSGVAFNAQITATFNEPIASGSVTSGSFRLSPAHNVTVFRDIADETKIVMTPNINMSGSTVYRVGINSQITDLAGNSISGVSGNPSYVFTWPFTTDAAPPPPDVTAPVVSGTSPTNGATNVSGYTNVTITFSEAMLSGSITASNIYLSYLSGVTASNGISGTVSLAVDAKTATIDPTPAFLSGSANVKINMLSGCRDLAGNNLVIDRSRNFTIAAPDLTPPTVVSTVPTDGALGVNVDANTVVVFSEAMLSGTINTTNLYLTDSDFTTIPAAVTLSGNQRAAQINPTNSLPETQYTINVTTGVQDLAGNAMTSDDTARTFAVGSFYNFQQVYLVTGSGTGDMYDGNDEKLGLVITGSCDLLGAKVKRITLRLRKNGSPTGTASIRLRKGSDDSIVKTFGTINVASLTSSYQDFTFTDTSQNYAMVVDDKLLVEYVGGSSSNRLEIQRTSSGDAYAGADYVQDDGSGYNPDSGKDVAWDIYE